MSKYFHTNIFVLVNSVEKVKEIVRTAEKFNKSVYVVSDNRIINLQSIMGIFSLNLKEKLEIAVFDKDELDNLYEYRSFFSKFITT